MSGGSPLEVGVGELALAFSVSLARFFFFFFFCHYLPPKVTISKLITILRRLLYIVEPELL